MPNTLSGSGFVESLRCGARFPRGEQRKLRFPSRSNGSFRRRIDLGLPNESKDSSRRGAARRGGPKTGFDGSPVDRVGRFPPSSFRLTVIDELLRCGAAAAAHSIIGKQTAASSGVLTRALARPLSGSASGKETERLNNSAHRASKSSPWPPPSCYTADLHRSPFIVCASVGAENHSESCVVDIANRKLCKRRNFTRALVVAATSIAPIT